MPIKSILFLSLLFMVTKLFTQSELQDVVYLKDGSIIRGTIVELIPDVSLKIETRDGSVFVYTMEQVMKVMKEPSKFSSFQQKSALNAFLLSFILVGVGQHYNGQYLKGGIMEGAALLGLILLTTGMEDTYSGWELSPTGSLGLVIFYSAWIWSFVDAPISAKKINQRNQNIHGHLIEIDIGQEALGLDLLYSRNRITSTLSFHF